MGAKMTVREFIKRDDDIDVYDDVCEELGIAFCGPLELTPEGEKQFSEVMGYEIEIIPGEETWSGLDHAIVHVDDADDKTWKRRLRKAKEVFESAAGMCPADDYDTWFKEA